MGGRGLQWFKVNRQRGGRGFREKILCIEKRRHKGKKKRKGKKKHTRKINGR